MRAAVGLGVPDGVCGRVAGAGGQAVVEGERCGMPDNAERSLTPGRPHDGNRLRIRCSAQDQSEWQIEWQTALACACPGLVNAGLCSCSSCSGV